MVRQSQATILLTRPQAQSERFAAELGLPALISPLLVPEFLLPRDTAGHFAAVVLTSETGVAAARRISATGVSLPTAAFCVGQRTEAAAAKAGFTVLFVAPNVSALSAHILALPPGGALLVLRPEDSAGELTETMLSAGIETVSWVTYRQKPCHLRAAAIEALCKGDPVLVPLFSPRSAQIFAAECHRIGAKAPLFCVAISQAAADALTLKPQLIRVARSPDGPEMRREVLDLLKNSLGS